MKTNRTLLISKLNHCTPNLLKDGNKSFHFTIENIEININSKWYVPYSQTSPSRTIPGTMKSIANMMKIHKRVVKSEFEEHLSLNREGQPEYGSTLTVGSNDVLLNMDVSQISPIYSESSQQLDSMPFSITTPVCVDKLQDRDQTPTLLKPQDFQVLKLNLT